MARADIKIFGFFAISGIAISLYSLVSLFKKGSYEPAFVLLLIVGFVGAFFSGYFIAVLKNKNIFMFKKIFEASNDAIAILNKDGKYIWQNPKNREFTGWLDNELFGKKATYIINTQSIELKDSLDMFKEFFGMFRYQCKNEKKEIFLSAYRIEDDFSNPLFYIETKRSASSYKKILEQTKREKESLQAKINKDPLTQILNRAGFYEMLLSRFENRELDGVIVFLDIDNFKRINDTFGHDTGDKVIKTCAMIISSNIRSNDIVARFGGEEFVIFLDTDLKNGYVICEKIRSLIENTKLDDGLAFTCSIGIARLIKDIDLSIKRADEAMYMAKQNGKNRVEINKELLNEI